MTQEDNNDISDNDNADVDNADDNSDSRDDHINSGNADVAVDCPIYLECSNSPKVISLQCGHRFHLACLYKYNSAKLEDKALILTFPLNHGCKDPNEKYI